MSKPKRTATPAARQTRASIQQRLAERDRRVSELDQQGLTPGEIARILHLSPKLVSEALARLGLVTTRQRDPALEADRERLADLDDVQLRQRLATLSDAAGLMVRAMELGVDAGVLARHALARGLPLAGADRIPAAASGWGSPETWTSFREEIAGRGMRVAAAFRDAQSRPRALVVCDDCAAEGGCGFTPEPKHYLGNLARGKPGLCKRRSGEQRGDAQRRSEAEARAAIEEGEYWTYLGGYQGAHAEVQLRCPEGHIGDYPYTKALRGQRCRACGPWFCQLVVQEVLRARYGGEWRWCDRRTFGFEIDCWCPHSPRIGGPIAAAHDGKQHEGLNVGPGRNRQDLAALQARDKARAEKLRERGIPFVVVKDLTFLAGDLNPANQARIFEAIEATCAKAGLPALPYERFDLRSLSGRQWTALKRIAAKRGNTLLVDSLPARHAPLPFRCERHGVEDVSTPATYPLRKSCCSIGAGERTRQGFTDKRLERVARLEAAGLDLASELPARMLATASWCCRTAGHRISGSVEDLERLVAKGIDPCPSCREVARKAGSPNAWMVEARVRLGLTLAELASRIGIPKGTLSNIETGRPMTPQQRARLRQALGLEDPDGSMGMHRGA